MEEEKSVKERRKMKRKGKEEYGKEDRKEVGKREREKERGRKRKEKEGGREEEWKGRGKDEMPNYYVIKNLDVKKNTTKYTKQ